MSKPTTVDEYIDSFPENIQAKLRELRAILKEIAPDATEAMKWGSPVFEEKRILFAYAAYKDHMNFMPHPSSLAPFTDELQGYKTGQGSVQLPYDKPIPTELIEKIARHRVWDVRENDAKWM
ncbi:MAG: iron chaperone [Weeksellaceae bacterium]